MAVQTAVHEKGTKRKATERGRRAAAAVVVETAEDVEERVEPREEVVVATPRSMPRIVSVYRSAVTGEVHHARCARELSFIGVRGGIEIDFYCLVCREHITLPEAALARVPVGQGR